MSSPIKPFDVSVCVLRLSNRATRPGFVQVELATANGTKAVAVFELSKVSRNPQPLFDMASALGIPLLRKGAQNALLHQLEIRLRDAQRDGELPEFEPADQPGWHFDAFVSPTDIYGGNDHTLLRAFEEPPPTLSYRRRGSLDDWKNGPGRLMQGNPMLIFLVCAALAPPLLRLLGWPAGFAFAIIGPQGKGKSSALTLAGSVTGGGSGRDERLVDSWRITPNGLERPAFFANDRVLLLDDAQSLSGSDKQRAIVMRDQIYMFVEGVNKNRKDQAQPFTWKGGLITSHNQTLRSVMADGQQRHDEAAEARLLEIPVFGPHGMFHQLHDGMDAAQFAEALVRRSKRSFGAPFHEYMTALTKEVQADKPRIVAWLEDRVSSMREDYLDLSVNEARAGKPFCLAYAAGRFAEEFGGILPVSSTEIREAIEIVYQAHRRHVAETTLQVDPIAALRHYIERHLHRFPDQRRDRRGRLEAEPLGFITESRSGRKEFSFLTAQFEKAVSPFSTKRTCDALKFSRLLVHEQGGPDSNGRNSTHRTIEGKETRVYCVSADILTPKSGRS